MRSVYTVPSWTGTNTPRGTAHCDALTKINCHHPPQQVLLDLECHTIARQKILFDAKTEPDDAIPNRSRIHSNGGSCALNTCYIAAKHVVHGPQLHIMSVMRTSHFKRAQCFLHMKLNDDSKHVLHCVANLKLLCIMSRVSDANANACTKLCVTTNPNPPALFESMEENCVLRFLLKHVRADRRETNTN